MSRQKPHRLTLLQKQLLPGTVKESYKEGVFIRATIEETQERFQWNKRYQHWEKMKSERQQNKDKRKQKHERLKQQYPDNF